MLPLRWFLTFDWPICAENLNPNIVMMKSVKDDAI